MNIPLGTTGLGCSKNSAQHHKLCPTKSEDDSYCVDGNPSDIERRREVRVESREDQGKCNSNNIFEVILRRVGV